MGLLDRQNFCTLFTAVDDHYLDKLTWTWPTWLLCHPELLNMDVIIMYDALQVNERDPRFQRMGEVWNRYREYHKRGKKFYMKVVPWQMENAESQRERMLTALVHGVAEVRTPWYLKLDADTYANEPKGFYYDKWFKGNPAFIGNPWGYTKPGTALETLNSWAKGTDLETYPGYPVEGQVIPRGDNKTWKVNHPRMASWVMFGNTEWCQQSLVWLEDDLKLPFPSQDTYFSYLAALEQRHFVVDKFRKYGWNHQKNPRHLKGLCEQCIEEHTRG